jgi:hypothetical protein
MSTNTAAQQPQKDGAGLYLGVVLLVVLPAVLAFICSKESCSPDGLVDRSGGHLTLVRHTLVPESVVASRMARRPFQENLVPCSVSANCLDRAQEKGDGWYG